MPYNFYALLSRMRNIRRWGLMRNTFEENLSEHSLMTAIFAHALATIGREVFGSTVDPDRCAACAIFHDASEIITGDLPTPVKYYNPELRDSYKRLETVSRERLLDLLPEGLRQTYRPLLAGGEGEEARLVHAADKLSAYVKCIEELKAGNLEFKKAAEQLEDTLNKMELPELEYFMKEFLPGFFLTLDEQEY